MNQRDLDAVIHMLVAQREQITATLLLLTKDDPAAEAEPVPKPGPRVFGRKPDGGP